MPPDLDAAFRKFIPPFGAAGNPVDITGGEPPKTYQNTIRLGLEDPRIHSLILGYWHTIVTPPMVCEAGAISPVLRLPAPTACRHGTGTRSDCGLRQKEAA